MKRIPMVALLAMLCSAYAWTGGKESEPADLDIYVVLFAESPLATYRGNLPGLDATHPETRGDTRLDPNNTASRAYLSFLQQRQRVFAHLDLTQ